MTAAPRALRGSRGRPRAGARPARAPRGLLTPVSDTGDFQAGGRFCGPTMGGEPSCEPRAALDAGRLLAVVGARRGEHLERARLGAAWLSPRWRRWAGTQPARRRGSLAPGWRSPRGGEAPGVKPGRPQPGTPGVHLGAGAPGLMAASEPACEGLFFPEA